MSFRPAGSRPVAVSAVAFVLALAAGGVLAHGATDQVKAPAAASSAQPAAAASTAPAAAAAGAMPVADANAAAKPGDAKAGQGKAAACGACHGMDGNSTDPQYPKLAGQSEQYIVRQLESFKGGQRQNPIMLGMASPLSVQDMHDIGAYFASQKPLPGVADQALVAEGEKLYREGDTKRDIPACMACHSIDGSGNPGAMYPHLGGQHAQYVEAQLKAWHDGTSWGTDAHAQIMPSIAQKLDAHDIAAVASYIEGLHASTPGDDTASAAAPK